MAKTKKIYNPCGHYLLSYRLGYVVHSEEMERRLNKGIYQFQCPNCKLWIYRDEMATSISNINKKP